MMNNDELCNEAYEMRKRFIEIFSKIGFGHITSAFSMTEIAVALYFQIINYDHEDPEWSERDRVVLSKGHGAGMFFPIFEKLNFIGNESLDEIIRIGGDYSKLQKFFYPGFDFYGGSLGIGLGLAVGLAKGALINNQKWLTFCILGDAECYEGSVWEAAIFAGHQNLNNLVAIVDRNQLGSSSTTENMVRLEPFADKWRACNWEVREINGHSFVEILKSLEDIRERSNTKPLCVIAETIKGRGLEYMYDKPFLHGYMPTENKAEEALHKLLNYRLVDKE